MIPVALLVRRPPALAAGAAAPARRASRNPDMSLGAGAALAAVHHPAADQLLLLRHAFRPDLPYRELCHQLRHPADRRGLDLQRRGSCRLGRPHRLRPCSATGSAPSACWSRACWSQAFGALAYVFVRELAGFYAVAALFGFIYAGVMPLYAVIARENFPLRMMGTVIGGTAMAGSLGMATGPLAGGLIYDSFASYAWLYVGSWAIRARRLSDRADVQAVSESRGAARAGVALPARQAVPNGLDCGTTLDESAHAVRPVRIWITLPFLVRRHCWGRRSRCDGGCARVFP